MTEALKPCPFCGPLKALDFQPRLSLNPLGHFVICRNCYCSTPKRSTPEMAIEVWSRRHNTRPTPQPSSEYVKAVEERFNNAAGELEEIRGMALQIEGSAKDDVSFAQARNIQAAVDRIQADFHAQVTKEGKP